MGQTKIERLSSIIQRGCTDIYVHSIGSSIFELALEVSIKTIREHPFVSKLIYTFMYDCVIQTKNCSENAKAKFEL